MMTSLKRLWVAAHSQFSPPGVVIIQRGPVNELQEKRPSFCRWDYIFRTWENIKEILAGK